MLRTGTSRFQKRRCFQAMGVRLGGLPPDACLLSRVSGVRISGGSPNHPNTLDQWAKSPVISRCSGFFMTGNFQSIPWINGSGSEVQTGFEPLFFHIQADFQWQRPFSEGCGGEIPEETKKNLSQSYGRWIVGFHEPNPAFFALKKGAADWRLEMSEENAPQKERYLREVEQKLLHRELDARPV